MKELTYVANKYSTDKGTEINTINKEFNGVHAHGCKHGFTDFYDYYFSKFKEDRPIILEIGVAEGGSIRMLNDYYHGNCEIYCIDYDESCLSVNEIGDNIHFILGDQSDPNFFKQLTYFLDTNNILFDFIIDDGSHIPSNMMLTFNYLHSYIKKNGFYIIEDIDTTYNKEYNNVDSEEGNPISFFTKLTDFYIFAPEVNNILHDKIKSSILFTNRNKYITNEKQNIMSMTMLIFLN